MFKSATHGKWVRLPRDKSLTIFLQNPDKPIAFESNRNDTVA